MGKLLMYMAPINTLGDNTTTTPVLGILSKFDYVVLAPHVGSTDIGYLRETLRALKIIKPRVKIFAHTSLGDAADMTAWQAQVTTWTTNVNHPTEALIDGVFIDLFGFENALSTRTNQNTAINFIRALNLSVMVNSTVTMNSISKYTSQPDSVLGTSTTIKDYVFLEGFYFQKAGSATVAVAEPKDSLIGRLSYVIGAKTNEELNIGIVGLADMANNTTIPVNDYKSMLDIASQYGLDAIGFAPKDYGATGHDYFLGKKINEFEV